MKMPEQQNLTIKFSVFDSPSKLSVEEQDLVQAARAAAKNAYAPYSGFEVGAAVKLSNGEIVTGNNQENAAYPSGLCAERVALFAAAAKYPQAAIEALAVTAIKNGEWITSPVPPCGSCRQVFVEWEKRFRKPFVVIMAGALKIIRIPESGSLMPFTFDAEYL